MSIWSGVLDSCPGLLCCVINIKGRLIYATNGYKAVAARVLGHKCEEGRNYPPLITDIDKAIHEALTAACLGTSNAIEITKGGNTWEFTASPLKLDDKNISGVVIRAVSVNPKTLAPVIQTSPDILNAVPFRACTVASKGIILAVNKFLSASLGIDPTGSNIAEIVEPALHSELMHIITNRAGFTEAFMADTAIHDNFYSFTPENVYLDEKHNNIHEQDTSNLRRIILHAAPIEWAGNNAALLTFEDITDSSRTQEQLRRLLTFDSSAGILNRRGIEHIILRKLGEAMKHDQNLSIIVFSLDNLSYITETLGWSAGEKAIKNFVKSMQSFLEGRAKSYSSVWGRGEFLVLALCSGAVSVVLANEIRDSAGVPVSAGIADFNNGGFSGVNDFIAGAYDAMIQAKLDGGNKTILAG